MPLRNREHNEPPHAPVAGGGRGKLRTLILPTALLLAATVAVGGILFSRWLHSQSTPAPLPDLVGAVAAFSRDLKARDQPLPASVSLQKLVAAGYLAYHEVKAFDGMEVSISLTASETYPQSTWIEARMPDDTRILVKGDGSVHTIAPE